MNAITPYKPAVLITLDDRLSKEDREIVISTLEDIFGIYEGVLKGPIPRCYSGKPCKYFPSEHLDLQGRIRMWEEYWKKIEANAVDPDGVIRDTRRHCRLFYDVNSHHHVIVIYPPAYDWDDEEIILGKTWPIVPTSIRDEEEDAIFEAPGVTVISVGSTKMLYGDDWRIAFRGVAAYQLGELHGIPDYKSPNYKDGYCSSEDCIMSGRFDIKSLKKILRNNPNLYCGPDLWYLRKNLKLIYGGQYESYLEYVDRSQYKS